MKFGYHGIISDVIMPSDEDFFISYYNVKNYIETNIGRESWSDIIRLHCWYATENQINFLKKEKIKELLTSNDNKISYALTSEEVNLINVKGFILKEGIIYRKTNVRFENSTLQEIVGLIDNSDNDIVAFTHEWCFDDNIIKMETIFEYLNKKGYLFM